MIRKSGNRFSSRQTRNAFARRSCSNKNMDDEHDSTQLKHALVADLAGDDIAEQPPRLTVELHQLHLFDREKIIRAGGDLDAGQQHLARKVLSLIHISEPTRLGMI